MTSISMPNPQLLHHFPEATVLALLDAALCAAELSLRNEHPAVDDLPLDPDHDIIPSLLTAHLILSRASELRHLLELYSAAVRRCVDFEGVDQDDLDAGPF
jgi:hypothetical protein